MLVAVQSFGSIWTARGARTATSDTDTAHQGAYYNTTGVLAGDMLRNRSCIYGHVRVDECSGFHLQFAGRLIHRVFDDDRASLTVCPACAWDADRWRAAGARFPAAPASG